MRVSARFRRAFLAAVLGAATLGQVPRASTIATSDALLARFAEVRGLRAHFREEKRMQLLAVPLVSTGEIQFAPPSHLLRRTLSPAPATMLLDGDHLRFADAGGRVQDLDLSTQPVARGFVDGFVALLAGNRASLARSYDAVFSRGDADGWHLVLRPRDDAARRVLREVRIDGRGALLDRIQIDEANGDSTTTTFTDVDVAHGFDVNEVARVFRLPR